MDGKIVPGGLASACEGIRRVKSTGFGRFVIFQTNPKVSLRRIWWDVSYVKCDNVGTKQNDPEHRRLCL